MLLIPGGTFRMGEAAPGSAYSSANDCIPIHNVTVNSFRMDKYDVTVAEFEQFAKGTNYITEGASNPKFGLLASCISKIEFTKMQCYGRSRIQACTEG